jgi:6-phosphofructokinase 1
VLVGIDNDKVVLVPFSKAIKNDKPIDPELIRVLKTLSI